MKEPNRAPLLILFLVNVLNIYDRQALGALLEPLRHQFHLTDTQLGALPTAFTLIYAVAGLPLGRLADTWSRKRLLGLAIAVWAGMTALGGLATNYLMLLITRLGVGIGEAVCTPVAASWIGDLTPPERRARAMAGFMTAVPVGVMLGFAVTGPVAQAWGWRWALAVAAAPAAALVPAVLWLSEPARGGRREVASGSYNFLKVNAFRWIVMSGAILNFALYSFSTFLPAFLTRYHGLTVAKAGLWSGIGSGIAGIVGAAAAGYYGDRNIGSRPGSRMILAAAASLAAALPGFAAIWIPTGQVALAVVMAFAAYGLLQMYYGLVYATIQDLVAPDLRGTAMAVYFVAMYLCGAAFGPIVTGGLSDRLARIAAGTGPVTEIARATGLHQAMYLIPALSVVLAAVLWAGAKAMDAQEPHIV